MRPAVGREFPHGGRLVTPALCPLSALFRPKNRLDYRTISLVGIFGGWYRITWIFACKGIRFFRIFRV